MSMFSIIVPVFHGTQYIDDLIRQSEECCRRLAHEDSVELVLVNDDPLEVLSKDLESDLIRIITLDTDINRGIHGARVRGLEVCTGDYVLFLDQDDRIAPGYFSSQRECIGHYDGVVCQVIHEKKRYYNTDRPFEQIMTKEYMMMNGCPVVSPGQVMLRKEAIPDIWKKEILTKNGADDFLLWLCMVSLGSTFALNEKILFEHIVQYENASWNSYNMMCSETEMMHILKEKHLFSGEDIVKLEQMLQNIHKKRLTNLDKFRKLFYILKDLTMVEESDNRIGTYLEKKNIREIAVYGIGYLGKYLLKILEKSRVKIRYIIDQNAAYLDADYPIVTLEDELEEVDAVIITLVQEEGEVAEQLKEKLKTKVFVIRELVSELEEEGTIW